MNDFFRAKLCQRPAIADRHARAVSNGLTKYDLPTVQDAALSLWEAHDAWVEVYAEWSGTINSHVSAEDRRYPAWERYADESIQQLMDAHRIAFDVAPSMGGDVLGRGRQYVEWFPLSRWEKKTQSYRRAARILRMALDKFATAQV